MQLVKKKKINKEDTSYKFNLLHHVPPTLLHFISDLSYLLDSAKGEKKNNKKKNKQEFRTQNTKQNIK